MPFTTLNEDGFPVPVLAQKDAKLFEICAPFKFRHRAEEDWSLVPKSRADRITDLASVPGFLLWFVPRYGHHTLAALVHDQLVDTPPPGGRVKADTIFRDLLGELKVPWIRRWLMWTAVSLGTIWHARGFSRLRLAVWFAVVLGANLLIWQHAIAAVTELDPITWWFYESPAWIIGAVLVASVLLAPRFGLGLLAGVAFLYIFLPSVVVGLFTLVYLGAEKLARSILSGYNALAGKLPLQPVDNVPAVMTLSGPQTDDESVCPPTSGTQTAM